MNPSPSLKTEEATFVQANGLRIYYEAHGTGTPVILIHGGLETCQMWAPAIPSLSMNYMTITPDSRGHGRSDNPTGQFSYSLMAADMAQFIKRVVNPD